VKYTPTRTIVAVTSVPSQSPFMEIGCGCAVAT
jgi:hypothetical protein